MTSRKRSTSELVSRQTASSVEFATRPSSHAWERIPLAQPPGFFWAWFKPQTVPQGAILRLADEPTVGANEAPPVAPSLRILLAAAGLDATQISMWYLYGVPYNAMAGKNPYLDAPIPRPLPGADRSIVVYVGSIVPIMPTVVPSAAAVPVVSAPVATGAMIVPPHVPAAGGPFIPVQDTTKLEVYERIEADWHSATETERDLARLRKQLIDMMGRLKNLNRDLTTPEKLHSNSQDKKDWLEARRGLRDASTRLWKYIKAHDIGDTSTAGQRKYFEETYQQFILPRRNFDGLEQAQRAFENYRKLVTTLHVEMQSAYSVASLDGERKAQQVMTRITTKVREATQKKNFLGVVLDS